MEVLPPSGTKSFIDVVVIEAIHSFEGFGDSLMGQRVWGC